MLFVWKQPAGTVHTPCVTSPSESHRPCSNMRCPFPVVPADTALVTPRALPSRTSLMIPASHQGGSPLS